LGLEISIGFIQQNNRVVHHYTLSCKNRSLEMNAKAALVVARILVMIRHRQESFSIQNNREGIYHIVFG
jgi:hypothetical protein